MKTRAWLLRELVAHRWRVGVALLSVAAAVAAITFFGGLGLALHSFTRDLGGAPGATDLVEVVPRSLELGFFRLNRPGLFGASGLDKQTLERLRHVDGVAAVYPKRIVRLPLGAEGGTRLFGKELYTDVLAEGLDPGLLARSISADKLAFQPGDPIPIIVSDDLLSLYNDAVAESLGLPKLAPDAIVGFTFRLIAGRSFMLGTTGAKKSATLTARIVGTSPYAMRIGVAVPLPVADWLESEFRSEASEPVFTSAWLRLTSLQEGEHVFSAVEKLGLKVADQDRRASDAARVAELALLSISLLVLGLAVIGIAHTFTAEIIERRGEFALLRSLGATPFFIARLVLFEAAWIGGVGGIIGALSGAGLAQFSDRALSQFVSDLPLHPAHFFVIKPELLLVAGATALVAALLGALLPLTSLLKESAARVLGSVED